MRQSKFTETQIVSILREAEAGRPANEILAEVRQQLRDLLQVEGQLRRSRRVGREASQELEQENSRLKRMYADLSLENAALKDVIAKKL